MRTMLMLIVWLAVCLTVDAADPLRALQNEAVFSDRSPVAHWGNDPEKYSNWTSHSLRLVPVYTYGTAGAGEGIDLASYTGANSPYRSAEALRSIYGYLPENSVNPEADYCDQVNLADMQRAALAAGKKYIFLVIFDGMDWQTTQLAALYATGEVAYTEGRGRGLHFLDYQADETTQYGAAVTSPHNDGTDVDVNQQTVRNPGGVLRSGYNAVKGGPNPWTAGNDAKYPIGSPENQFGEHAYPDSANTATAMTSGVKSYNNAINVDHTGVPVPTVAHEAQEQGYAVGAVSSVPITHATPAAAYAHNVSRHDFQDLARDLLGQPSISHPDEPLPGLDVIVGGGYGAQAKADDSRRQGDNFIPGAGFVSSETVARADVRSGGPYTVAVRTFGRNGSDGLAAAASRAVEERTRLLGIYGIGTQEGHLPYQTANGDYQPANGIRDTAEVYTPEDLFENPTLAEMTAAAIQVLSTRDKGFWLMVEAGDVDWANHDNNLDNSIGAVKSGDDAVRIITDWVEQHSNWDESLLIVTADHGHYLNIDQPEAIAAAGAASRFVQRVNGD